MDVVVALPFTVDACLVASSFEADAGDVDDAAELTDGAAAVFEDSALVSDTPVFVSDIFAAGVDLAVTLARTTASSAFVVAVEADDAALSADFPTAVALAEAYPALVDVALADNATAVFESATAGAFRPVIVSEGLTFISGVFAASAELTAAVAEEAVLLAFEAALVSGDSAASSEADASRAEAATFDVFAVAVDAEATTDRCDTTTFVSDVFVVLASVVAALSNDSTAAALFAASRVFIDVVPVLEDAD